MPAMDTIHFNRVPQGTPEWILYSSLAFYSGVVSGSCNEFSRTLRFPVYNQTQDIVRGKVT